MNSKIQNSLRNLVVNVIALYAILGLTFVSFLNLFNQSSLTPESEQFGVFNYLLPYFLTIGFIIYFTFQRITSKAKNEQRLNSTKLILISIAAVIAIPWQIEQLYWEFTRETIFLLEIIPYFIGIYFTMMSTIFVIVAFNKMRQKQ